jgi:hypothetical protein
MPDSSLQHSQHDMSDPSALLPHHSLYEPPHDILLAGVSLELFHLLHSCTWTKAKMKITNLYYLAVDCGFKCLKSSSTLRIYLIEDFKAVKKSRRSGFTCQDHILVELCFIFKSSWSMLSWHDSNQISTPHQCMHRIVPNGDMEWYQMCKTLTTLMM